MNDLLLHGLGRGIGGSGVAPIEGVTPIMASNNIQGAGLPFVHRPLGTLSDRRGVNHYHAGKLYVLHTTGVTIYDCTTGNVIAENTHTTANAHMSPDTAESDGSYYLAQGGNLYKYALDGSTIWEMTGSSDNPKSIAVDASGVYIGVTSSTNHYVRKYNRNTGQSIWSSPNLSEEVYALAVNSTTIFVATYRNYLIRRLNVSNGSIVYSYTMPNNQLAYALAIEPGTNHFYSIDGYRMLRKHSYQTGEPIFERSSANTTTVYNLFIDSDKNIYTLSSQEITKLDNQLAGFIWREAYNINQNPICGYGFDEPDIYILRKQTCRILSTEKEWSDFIPYQFEGAVNAIDCDQMGNFYGVSDDWTARKFNAVGEKVWTYRSNLVLNFIKVDRNGQVFVADTNRTVKKLNQYGEVVWSCTIPNTTGAVTDLVTTNEGTIILGIHYWHTSTSNRKNMLVKISPEGTLLKVMELGTSEVLQSLQLWDNNTILAFNKLYDVDTFRCLRYFNEAKTVFGRHDDFLYDINGTTIKAYNAYSNGKLHDFRVLDVNISSFYLRVAQAEDGNIYVWDNDQTLIKISGNGDEFWRYRAAEKIADVKVDHAHTIYVATGFYIEKLKQNVYVKNYQEM